MFFRRTGYADREVKPMSDHPHPRPEPKYPAPLTHENLSAVFRGAADFTVRSIRAGRNGQTVWIYAIDGLVASGEMADFVVKPLLQAGCALDADTAVELQVPNAVARRVEDLDSAVSLLVNGFCLALFGENDAAAFEVKTGEKRAVSPPTVENTIKGPKDAFTETVRSNTGLLRRHLRSPELRLKEHTVGRRSLTNVTVCFIAGLTDPALVQAVEDRLDTIDIDGLLSPAALEEYLTGSRKTAFPLLLYTERPDRFAWGLLAGRVGVLADGLPLGYLLPCTAMDFLESPEDRGGNYLVASAVKLLRIISVAAALLLPGLFAAVCLYHQEMVPLPLLRAIEESRQAVPVPVGVEILLLLVAFELLQEAGLQLPQNLGHAVSIIGGLVVGTAAVEASLISPAALIAVAASGVCSFTLPQRDFADGLRLWRFAVTLGGVTAGLAGVTLLGILLLIHLADLRSLGVPYISPPEQDRGTVLRPRLVQEKHRKGILHPVNLRNQR